MGQFISKPKDWSTEVRSQEDSRYYFLNDRFDLLPSIVDFSFKMPLPPKSEKSSSAAKAVTVVWKYITNSNAFDSKTMYIYGSPNKSKGSQVIVFTVAGSKTLFKMVAPFIHSSMYDKLLKG
jgi:hypothetical protein